MPRIGPVLTRVCPAQCPESVRAGVRRSRDDFEDFNPLEAPTEKCLVRLHRRVLVCAQASRRTLSQWGVLLDDAIAQDEVATNEASPHHRFVRSFGAYDGPLRFVYTPRIGTLWPWLIYTLRIGTLWPRLTATTARSDSSTPPASVRSGPDSQLRQPAQICRHPPRRCALAPTHSYDGPLRFVYTPRLGTLWPRHSYDGPLRFNVITVNCLIIFWRMLPLFDCYCFYVQSGTGSAGPSRRSSSCSPSSSRSSVSSSSGPSASSSSSRRSSPSSRSSSTSRRPTTTTCPSRWVHTRGSRRYLDQHSHGEPGGNW